MICPHCGNALPAHRHRPLPSKQRTVGYVHCQSPGRCNPRSHGGVTFIDVCRCGAQRRTNGNAGGREIGPWEGGHDE
jgi:hypothetical protein